MKAIHVTRKPVEGTVARNALKWGTGGINIDRSRIGSRFTSAGGNNFDAWRAGEGREDRPEAHKAAKAVVSEGRWPPNVVFEHACGCRKIGQRKVQSDFLEAGDEAGIVMTVDVWVCVDGCPVKALEEDAPGSPQFFLQFQGEAK
jgi:hypothetical protein